MIDFLRYILFSGDIIRTVLIMSISGSVLSVVLTLLKPFLRERLPKAAQYYLWLVVIAAFLIPISLFIVVADNNATTISSAPIQKVISQTIITAEEEKDFNISNIPSEVIKEAKADNEWISFSTSAKALMISKLVFAYPFGVLIVLLYYVISYYVFLVLQRRRNTMAKSEEIAIVAELCGDSRVPFLYRNSLATTPMLIGLFRSAIILPDREYTPTQLRSVLMHELTHLRKKDIIVKWLSVVVCAVHWFNPVVWLIRREIDRACELSCDESIIRNLDADGKQSYGDTLIYVAADIKTPKAFLSTTMCEEKKALKERLGAIMRNKKNTRITIILSVILICAAIGTTIVLGAGSKDAVSNFNVIIINDIVVDINATEGASIPLYDDGIQNITIFKAYLTADDYLSESANDIRDVQGVEKFFGKGKIGWFDYEQRLRYVRYKGANGIQVTFIYTDGVDGDIDNRLVRVEITPPTGETMQRESLMSRLFTSKTTNETLPLVPEKTPLLDVSLEDDKSQRQDISAAQLTNSWFVADKNGDGFGYSADSVHPLQLAGYTDITLMLYSTSGEAELQFRDNYKPLLISVQRWDAKNVGEGSTDVWDNGEPVEVIGNMFHIVNDGSDYVYEVYAKWNEGSSWYAFRVDSSLTSWQREITPTPAK